MRFYLRFIGPALLAAACAAPAQVPGVPGGLVNSNQQVIQLRMARPSAAPGHTLMQSLAIGGKKVYVNQLSILDDQHIARAQAHRRSGHLTIDVLLTPEGAVRLREATRAFVGQQLAVLIGPRLATAVPIVSPLSLSTGWVTIGVQLDDASAIEFSARIASKWPKPSQPPWQKD